MRIEIAKHTAPNKQRSDDAYPVRIKIRVPPNGLGNLSRDITVWLRDYLPDNRSANQSTRGVYCEAAAFYFRNLTEAQMFLDAFPALDLADEIDRAFPPPHL